MPSTFEISVNGERRHVELGSTVQRLLEDMGLNLEFVAVEVNRVIVRRPDWPHRLVQPGDQIEIVHFVGGGSI